MSPKEIDAWKGLARSINFDAFNGKGTPTQTNEVTSIMDLSDSELRKIIDFMEINSSMSVIEIISFTLERTCTIGDIVAFRSAFQIRIAALLK
ncbi:hypothetical protein JKY72_06820 [Candidatus Gracilibacteria bacterium]|nr:hypothetical protein [Candidatus Gracilibacteria bacterium]